MSNLLGQPFDDWVTKQIDVRQKSLGKYSTTQIQANLVKTPWIRLASSVNLEFPENIKDSVPQKLENAGLNASDLSGVELAKKSILYGGVVSMTGENNNVIPNSSINNGKSLFNGAYGWGGIDERGYVPMPGITDVSLQYQNNGALSKTTINIKCFSKRQFQIIDVLYLRPGYSLLLEFGHSTYLNNDGEYDSFENFSSQPLRTLFNPGDKTQYDIYKEIKETREEYNGNYEAVYGKITTFKWSFNTDGSYDCQITLTGMGDVIESLKMNISVDDDDDDDEDEDDSPPLKANKDKSVLNKILYNIYQSLSDETTFGDFSIKGYPNPDNDKFKKEDKTFSNNIFSIGGVDTPGLLSDNQSPQVYITFGVLLAIIQTKIILHTNRGSDISIPLFRFDMKFNNLKDDENYILKIPGQFSSDPRICIIPYSNTISPLPNLELITTDINTKLSELSYWDINNEPYVGRLAGIFVNIDYLAKVLNDIPLDEENNANMLDFLKGVIKGITQSLGGINKINITITEDGLIRFIEEIPQRLKKIEDIEEKKYARFNVFGVKPGIEGSFLTSVNLDAEIPNSFSATVAIGSQSNGNRKSGNATAFSNYNKGLKDRIIPEKKPGTEESNENEDEEQKDKLVENVKKILKVGASLRSPFGAIYNAKNWFPNNIDTLTNLNTTHASLMLGRLTQPDNNGNQQLQSPFFLPFNFSIEMEGLSGMVLYQKFRISEEILPPSYEKGGVDIQIKGIDHTVNDKGWKTKLETQSVPAAKLSPTVTPYPLDTSGGGDSSSSTSTGGSSSTSTGGSGGNAGGGQVGAGGNSTPNNYPVGEIYYDGPTNKIQIYLHHTAGSQNIKGVIAGWNTRTDHVSTHFITNNAGQAERLYPDEAWGNHLGVKSSTFKNFGATYQNLNKVSLGIEMCSYGGLKLKGGKYVTYVNNTIPESEVARPVDKNGKAITYKGYEYYQKYSDAHITAVKNIILAWKKKYNIPFKYDYDTLFTLNKTPFTGAKGIYTHNSVRTDKIDVFPQAELITMLKSISD